MKLKDLIFTENKLNELEISGVTCDSRAVKDGFAFVCIKGAIADGHDYANKAIELGASVVIAEHDLGLENQKLLAALHEQAQCYIKLTQDGDHEYYELFMRQQGKKMASKVEVRESKSARGKGYYFRSFGEISL